MGVGCIHDLEDWVDEGVDVTADVDEEDVMMDVEEIIGSSFRDVRDEAMCGCADGWWEWMCGGGWWAVAGWATDGWSPTAAASTPRLNMTWDVDD